MPRITLRKPARTGNTVVLAAVMMVVLTGIVALAVDVGYVAVARNEGQNAADSGALAGAVMLLDRGQLAGNSSETARLFAARVEAQKFAQLHRVAGQNVAVDRNDSNDLAGDIVIGHLQDPKDTTNQTFINDHPYNSVLVRIRGNVPKIFGTVFSDKLGAGPGVGCIAAVGTGSTTSGFNVSLTAIGNMDGQITGFQIPKQDQTCKLLPFTLHIDTWKQLVSGIGEDNWRYDRETKTLSAGSDGIKEAKLYPDSDQAGGNLPPGNFGTIDIGGANNSTNDIKRQILYGPNKQDLDKIGGKLALGWDGTTTLNGDTGVSSTVKDDLEAIRGQPRIIPLYNKVTGNGNNANYTIVGFAGIIITDVVMTGKLSERQLTIQPEFAIDETAIPDQTTNASWFVYRGPYLAR